MTVALSIEPLDASQLFVERSECTSVGVYYEEPVFSVGPTVGGDCGALTNSMLVD